MIIQNFTKLGDTKNKQRALDILETGLFAAMPEHSIPGGPRGIWPSGC